MLGRVLTGTALVLGVLLAAVALVAAPGVALGGAAFGAALGGLGVVRVRDIAPGDAASKRRTGGRGGLIIGAVAVGGWLAVTGLVIVLGPASGAVLVTAAVVAFAVWLWRRPDRGAALRTNPWPAAEARLLRAAARPRHPAPGRVSRRPVPVEPPVPMRWSVPAPATLSTPQLCLAWQHTYFVMLDLPAGAPLADMVHVRKGLLDEIERRDPDGFTRWLDTGARAGSDPGRFLAGDR